MRKILLILLFGTLSGHALELSDSQKQQAQQLSESSYWLKLMHYHSSLFHKAKSLVDGPHYFFAEDGQTDPFEELIASAEVMDQDLKVGPLQQHPQCAFPVRYRFLKKQLGLTVKDVRCADFEEWIGKINPGSTSMIFASNYPNSPVSIFGHTLIRVNSKASLMSGKKNDLLDYGIGYEAHAQHGFGFQFAMHATFGGYPGRFSLQPYYMKVDYYSNFESRDVWEYDLNLTEEQTWRMVAHVWELEANTFISYYFMDQNCAYLLMELLEVAQPEWQLTKHFPVYAMPSETIKVLAETKNAIRKVHFRPSLRKRMYLKIKDLDEKETQQFLSLKEGRLAANGKLPARVLDVASDYYYYVKQKSRSRFSESQQKKMDEILLARSQTESRVQFPPPQTVSRRESNPELSHGTHRLGIAGGELRENSVVNLQFKLALHDLLDRQPGYAPLSQTDFFRFDLNHEPDTERTYLSELVFARIFSLFPVDRVEQDISWRVTIQTRSPPDLPCFPDCQSLEFDAAAGAAIRPLNSVLFYGLAGLETAGSAGYQRGYRWGPNVEVGTLLMPKEIFKTHIFAKVQSDLDQSDRPELYGRWTLQQSYHFAKNYDVRLLADAYFAIDRGGLSQRTYLLQLNHYW